MSGDRPLSKYAQLFNGHSRSATIGGRPVVPPPPGIGGRPPGPFLITLPVPPGTQALQTPAKEPPATPSTLFGIIRQAHPCQQTSMIYYSYLTVFLTAGFHYSLAALACQCLPGDFISKFKLFTILLSKVFF